MGLSDAPTYLADDPAGVFECGSQARLAPVRLDVAPGRCSTAVCGHILAVALSNRGVQPATGPGRLGKPSKHRAEILARDMNQAGTGPDPIVRRAGTLRIGQVFGQRVQQVGLEATFAKQFDEAL
jgi:hypothetical protein